MEDYRTVHKYSHGIIVLCKMLSTHTKNLKIHLLLILNIES